MNCDEFELVALINSIDFIAKWCEIGLNTSRGFLKLRESSCKVSYDVQNSNSLYIMLIITLKTLQIVHRKFVSNFEWC